MGAEPADTEVPTRWRITVPHAIDSAESRAKRIASRLFSIIADQHNALEREKRTERFSSEAHWGRIWTLKLTNLKG